MYMTSADLRAKLLGDAEFAVQLQTDAAAVGFSSFDILDDARTKASAEKIDRDANLLNTYINIVDAINNSAANTTARQRLPIYIRAPFGEPEFTIDTNTRVINVPSEFTKNGVGVVGDHLAEILFFTLPRFFDVMDLYACDKYVYWHNTALKGEDAVNHVERPIAVYVDGDNLHFGWALSKELTTVAGVVEFGIEFVHRTNGAADFRLVTQPAKLTVKAALEFDNYEALESAPEDYQNLIYTRDVYSNIINSLSAAAPVIVTDLDPENNVFDATENNINFEIAATSPDNGQILYNWVWNNVSVEQPSGANINDPATGAETYELIEDKEIVFSDEETATHTYKKLKTNVPGIYVVYVGNKNSTGGIRYIYSESVVIEAADEITISDLANPQVIYLDGENPNFVVDVQGANGTLVYQWHRINPDTQADTIRATTTVPSFNPNSISTTSDSVVDADLRGLWQCEALNRINNTQTHAYSNWIFFEIAPRKILDQNLSLTQNGDTFTVSVANMPFAQAQYRMYAEVKMYTPSNNGVKTTVLDVASSHKIFDGPSTSFSIAELTQLTRGTEYDIDVFVVPVVQYQTEYVRYPLTIVDGKETLDYTRVSLTQLYK